MHACSCWLKDARGRPLTGLPNQLPPGPGMGDAPMTWDCHIPEAGRVTVTDDDTWRATVVAGDRSNKPTSEGELSCM